MKKTTNAQQKNYMVCKAAVETLKAAQKEIEVKYMDTHGIVDENGENPGYLWCIDNDEVFEQAVAATSPEIEKLGIPAAENLLREAEDALINYSLSIMPNRFAKEREILRNACFGLNGYCCNVTTRMKMLESTVKLDVSTVA